MKSTKLLSSIERLLGLEPLPAPPHVFSVDAGRVAYGRFPRSAAGGYELQEFRSVHLPEGCFGDGPLVSSIRGPEELARALDALLSGISAPVDEAALVLPDDWLRMTFVQLDEVPRSREARDDILRWKLKRVLPVRTEELRLRAVEVSAVPGQRAAHRLLVAFAFEALLAGLEATFAARGIRIGRVGSEILGLETAVAERIVDGLAALALVGDGGYTLLFTRRGEPVLYRLKTFDRGAGEHRAESVARDLKLTRAFLAEHLPETSLEHVLVAAPPSVESSWATWLGEGLGTAAEVLDMRQLGVRGDGELPWPRVAPMIGAVSLEIE